MNEDNTEANVIYSVVMNHEEQHSIWPTHREMPLSLRKRMDEADQAAS
jgi:uncharacterized protein YbdZ (MbtH family)